jgi:8-oxo-dGTP pyrophosphatase MutT (NUDIX family)
MPSSAEPAAAATLILFRERAGLAPELLMVERSGAMAFAAGALVFPGGRVDPGDHALAGPAAAEDGAARIAAIRETIEEVGIAVGITPAPSPGEIGAIRAGLAAGTPFATLLARAGLSIDLTALCPMARWLPRAAGRIYDTRFYLARAPAGAIAAADGGESVRAIWTSAAAALAGADAGRHRIIYPTRRNLERLALAGTFEAACADASSRPIATVTPWIEQRGGEDWVCIRTDQGYPVTAERAATALRG